MPTLTIREQTFPLAAPFTISRGSKTEARVVIVDIVQDTHRGWAECVPYPRYGETPASVIAQIESIRPAIQQGITRDALQSLLPAGAARNALDCALWQLEARQLGTTVAAMLNLPLPKETITAVTISRDTPEAMGRAAANLAGVPLLKLKLGGREAGQEDIDLECLAAVHHAAPNARLIADANEGWTADWVQRVLPELARYPLELVEQPLPAGEDAVLANLRAPFCWCADESAHTRDSLSALAGRYQAVNIKLDKTGGLTEAAAMLTAARKMGLKTMLGCMVGSSLAMLPALHLAEMANWVDLDGPLFLQADRTAGLIFNHGHIRVDSIGLWG